MKTHELCISARGRQQRLPLRFSTGSQHHGAGGRCRTAGGSLEGRATLRNQNQDYTEQTGSAAVKWGLLWFWCSEALPISSKGGAKTDAKLTFLVVALRYFHRVLKPKPQSSLNLLTKGLVAYKSLNCIDICRKTRTKLLNDDSMNIVNWELHECKGIIIFIRSWRCGESNSSRPVVVGLGEATHPWQPPFIFIIFWPHHGAEGKIQFGLIHSSNICSIFLVKEKKKKK